MKRFIEILRKYFTLIFWTLGGIIMIVLTIKALSLSGDNKFKEKLINDFMEVKQISTTQEEEYKAIFITKAVNARQVYQWSFYRSTPTKIGNLQLEKVYAMNLEEFDHIMQLCWKFNRLLSIPLDSPVNYYIFSKEIVESSLCDFVQHKTGEVIRFAGYTWERLKDALNYYLYESNIAKGSPFYIPELFQGNLTKDQIIKIFQDNIDNVIKLDYCYFQYLLSLYDWRWDWALTSFHFGNPLTEYWWGLGLRNIPDFRLNGHWANEFLRNYYLSIFEIADGINQGYNQRISRYEKIIGLSSKCNLAEQRYIDFLRLKVRQVQGMDNLERKYNDLQKDYTNFRKLNKQLIEVGADLNDIILDKGDGKDLKNKVRIIYNKLKGIK